MKKKVTLELTETEYDALAELLAVFNVSQYKKAFGEKVITVAKIGVTNVTARVLNLLDRKING